jgi:hypothetical protein
MQKAKVQATPTVDQSADLSQNGFNFLRLLPAREIGGDRGQVEVAPESQTRQLSTTLPPLELLWTSIAKCLMQALPVIEPVDIVLNGDLGLNLILKLPVPN